MPNILLQGTINIKIIKEGFYIFLYCLQILLYFLLLVMHFNSG